MHLSRAAVAYDCLFPFTTGGGERQYRAFAEALESRGIATDYLTAEQWPAASPPQADFRVVAVTGRLRLYDAEGVRRGTAAAAFAWGLFRTLRRRRSSYDLVIVSGLPVLNVFAARLALWGTQTTLIVDYLEVWGRCQWIAYAGPLMGRIAWLLQRAAITATPRASCHSALSASRLRGEGYRRTLLQSPGLIDERSARSAADGRPAADPPYVLYVGRHIADKRVATLPAAVAEARRQIPDLRLVVLGEGATTPDVRTEIAAAGGRDWATLPGFVPQSELDDLLAGAACVVNPSRREGYGLVVVESAAHGTPVVLVADEGNAATELVVPGANGFIASSDRAEDLGEAIAAAVLGGDRLRRSTRAWYRDAVKSRTISRTIDNIVSAAAEGGARGPSRTRK